MCITPKTFSKNLYLLTFNQCDNMFTKKYTQLLISQIYYHTNMFIVYSISTKYLFISENTLETMPCNQERKHEIVCMYPFHVIKFEKKNLPVLQKVLKNPYTAS